MSVRSLAVLSLERALTQGVRPSSRAALLA